MTTARVDKSRITRILGLTLSLCLLPLVLLSTGCHMVKTAVDVPGDAIRSTIKLGKGGIEEVDPVTVQNTLLRFADEYFSRIAIGTERLQHGTNAVDPVEVLQWKIALGTVTVNIATGPSPVADLLDMTVFVTVTRDALEKHWVPDVFGESAKGLLEGCRESETNIWRLADAVLHKEQREELRQAIEKWTRENPRMDTMMTSRALGFTAEIARANKPAQAGADTTGSVFSLLRVDPLAGLDPATREIAQTRLFAERGLYFAQKMPTLVRWQTELLTLNAMAQPAIQQLVGNSTELTASVDRLSRVAEQLPRQISAEREAIVKELQSQEKQLTPLVNDVRQTLLAGSQMSASLNTTLITFDTLMKRFGVGETNNAAPPDTNSPPFNILDYAKTATQLGAAAQKLTELMRTLDETTGSNNLSRLSAQVGPVVQQAQSGGKEVVDYAFWKGVLLVAIVLAAALIYRFLSGRMTAVDSNSRRS